MKLKFLHAISLVVLIFLSLASCNAEDQNTALTLGESMPVSIIISRGYVPSPRIYTLNDEEIQKFISKLDELNLVQTSDHDFTAQHIRTGDQFTGFTIHLEDETVIELAESGYRDAFIDVDGVVHNIEDNRFEYPYMYRVSNIDAIDDFWDYVTEISGIGSINDDRLLF